VKLGVCIPTHWILSVVSVFNPLNAELDPICHLLALLGGATIVVLSRLRVNSLAYQVYVLYFSIKLCLIEDLLKSLHLLLLSMRSAIHAAIGILCPHFNLMNLLCLIIICVDHGLCWAETYSPH
jgi:hypothetical protein